jgi:pyridoxal phosphate enzyme (YggS family)
MPIDESAYRRIVKQLDGARVLLVAVSKTKSTEEIRSLYDMGQRDFGENYVQELVDKQSKLPTDIRWHYIGHLQTNKVKYIVPFVYLIHSVDSLKLLREIDKQARKEERVIDVLLQLYIAREESKFGLDENELAAIAHAVELKDLKNICVRGFMGMASFTDDQTLIRSEFRYLKSRFNHYQSIQTTNWKLETLSMGMSSDFTVAVEEGSTLVRIGSLLFGARDYAKP